MRGRGPLDAEANLQRNLVKELQPPGRRERDRWGGGFGGFGGFGDFDDDDEEEMMMMEFRRMAAHMDPGDPMH